ncbi:MAG: hypothetical protein HY059_19240 [Proteobacteria bacterium]|nr:hypothetical protein [Pseudomonadota bacterium]
MTRFFLPGLLLLAMAFAVDTNAQPLMTGPTRYDTIFARFVAGDTEGTLDDITKFAANDAADPKILSRALTLEAAIVTVSDPARAKRAFVRALELDPSNGMALGHHAFARILEYSDSDQAETMKAAIDLLRAIELGDGWAARMIAEKEALDTQRSQSRRRYFLTAAQRLGHPEVMAEIDALNSYDGVPVLLPSIVNKLWQSRDAGVRDVYARLFSLSRQGYRAPADTAHPLMWAYASTLMSEHSDVLKYPGLVAEASRYSDEERRLGLASAREFFAALYAKGVGRWAGFAKACAAEGSDYPAFEICTYKAEPIARLCLRHALWMPMREFRNTQAQTRCVTEVVAAFRQLSPKDAADFLK